MSTRTFAFKIYCPLVCKVNCPFFKNASCKWKVSKWWKNENGMKCFCLFLCFDSLSRFKGMCYSHFGNSHIWVLVRVGCGASWRGEPIFLNYNFMFRRIHSSCLEGHMASMFGRTLFEYCVPKTTLHYVPKDTFHLLTLKWSEYLCHVKRNP